MKKTPIRKRILFGILAVAGAAVCAVCIMLIVLTVTEYKPEDVETVAVNGNYSKTLSEGDSVTVLDWNVGYGALGDNADFFMDGGEMVISSTAQRISENLDGIVETVDSIKPDVIFFQEVDVESRRSHLIDEEQTIFDALSGYQETFAHNYKCIYVPYPLPPIGKVEGGVMTMSSYQVTAAERIKLPSTFQWPVRTANLKRCLLINRIPLENSDKELVLINLHLEAYDEGEGKRAQTAFLKKILEEEAANGNYVIAGGDFNQTFSNADISAYPVISDEMWHTSEIDVSEFDESFQFVTDVTVPTCRSLDRPYVGADKETFQYYVIDGFILSGNLLVNSMQTMDTQFVHTDHNPLVLSVTLQPEE